MKGIMVRLMKSKSQVLLWFILFVMLTAASIVAILTKGTFPLGGKSKDHSDRSPDFVCWKNIRFIGQGILRHARQTDGRLPTLTESDGGSEWIAYIVDETADIGDVIHRVKCSLDVSRSTTSYEMNPSLSGKRFQEIPSERWSTVILLRERRFSGSHGYRFFLDGHTDQHAVRGWIK